MELKVRLRRPDPSLRRAVRGMRENGSSTLQLITTVSDKVRGGSHFGLTTKASKAPKLHGPILPIY